MQSIKTVRKNVKQPVLNNTDKNSNMDNNYIDNSFNNMMSTTSKAQLA